MKRLLSLILALVLSIAATPAMLVSAKAAEAVPNGFIGIYTAEDLVNIADAPGENYILMKDIDLTAFGKWKPIEAFTGIFDGNGHVISNIQIIASTYYDSSNNGAGLFASADQAIIKNVANINGTITYSKSSVRVGGLVGYAKNTTISHCFSSVKQTIGSGTPGTGIITTTTSRICSGGIVGYAKNSTISMCANGGDISIIASGTDIRAGGIAGWYDDTTIENCYNSASVHVETNFASAYVGGIAGSTFLSGKSGSTAGDVINNCYNVGKITCKAGREEKSYAGGIEGGVNGWSNTTTITNCYYLKSLPAMALVPEPNNKGVTRVVVHAAAVSQSALRSCLYGFDYGTVWEMGSGDYPYPVLIGLSRNGNSSVLPVPALSVSPGKTVRSGTAVRFSWLPVSGAAVYYITVYDKTNGAYPLREHPVSGTSFSLMPRVAQTSLYGITVRAGDGTGALGTPSSLLELTVIGQESDASGVTAGDYYLIQTYQDWCTYCATANMMRQYAILHGRSDWASFTDIVLMDKNVAWAKGGGLKYEFSYNGISVASEDEISNMSMTEKKRYLIQKLEEHPEGIVIYSTGSNRSYSEYPSVHVSTHAIYLNRYDPSTDTFYCVDSARQFARKADGKFLLKDRYGNDVYAADGKLLLYTQEDLESPNNRDVTNPNATQYTGINKGVISLVESTLLRLQQKDKNGNLVYNKNGKLVYVRLCDGSTTHPVRRDNNKLIVNSADKSFTVTQEDFISTIDRIWYIPSTTRAIEQADIELCCPVEAVLSINGEDLDSRGVDGTISNTHARMTASGSDGDRRITMSILEDITPEDDFSLQIFGTGEGTMRYTVDSHCVDGTTDSRAFVNVPITATTVVHTESFHTQSPYLLTVTDLSDEDAVSFWVADTGEISFASNNEFFVEPDSEVAYTDVGDIDWYLRASLQCEESRIVLNAKAANLTGAASGPLFLAAALYDVNGKQLAAAVSDAFSLNTLRDTAKTFTFSTQKANRAGSWKLILLNGSFQPLAACRYGPYGIEIKP